jgi:nucleoside 2-deoxyribosyltransferase
MSTYAYLAGRFSSRFALQGVRSDLLRINIGCTSRWLDLREEDESQAAECAKIDIADIELADLLISFPTARRALPPSRGGFCWEQGYATALGKRVIVIANKVYIFDELAEYFETWQACLATLKQEQRPALRRAA